MSYSAGTQSYNLTGLLPQHWMQWDDYQTRLGRYEVFEGYYHNVAYHSIMAFAETLKFTERLYKHVRGVYNPVARLVEMYVSKIYGGALDTQTADQGAIPIVTDNERLKEAIITLWKASRWNQKKSLYVRNGAKFGDSFIKVVDDIQRGSVYLEVVDPRKIKAIELDPSGRVQRVEIEYLIPSPGLEDTGHLLTYNETITPESFTITVDGKPAEMATNGRGGKVSEWTNEYGFVPLVAVQHRDVGNSYGGNAWYTSMHKINELNDIASILNDGARRQVQMPLVAFGQRLVNDFGTDQSTNSVNRSDKPRKDTVTVLEMNENARLEALPPTISIADTLGLIEQIVSELENDMPELALHRLRESSVQTAPGIRSAYSDAVSRFEEGQGNYDAGLIEAQKMAVAIGGMRNYTGYQGFNIMSLERGDLEHQIGQRPVIGDTLSRSEKVSLTFTAMSHNAPEAVYQEIGWGGDDIEQILEAQKSNTASFINQFGAPEDDTPPEAPEDAIQNERSAQIDSADLLAAQQELEAA